jgi:hypothetical protein
MEAKIGSVAWFGQKVLPTLTATGIVAVCIGVVTLIQKVDQISVAVNRLNLLEERFVHLERNSFDLQMAERVAITLDNAELQGKGNFATKAVSRVLKQEVKIKLEGK